MPNNQPFIIGFNGPPKSGKDTVSYALANRLESLTDLPIFILSLAEPMREATMSLCSIATRREYDEVKDLPARLLAKAELIQDGINTFENYGTVREFMIRLSEDFIKPTYGRDFWARALVERSNNWWGTIPAFVILTDVGFQEEVSLLEILGGTDHYLGVQLDREGTTWELDSRGYVESTNTCRVRNDLSADSSAGQVINYLLESPMQWPLKTI